MSLFYDVIHEKYFKEWKKHYKLHLDLMFKCVEKESIKLNRCINYEDFCHWIYQTSSKTFNKKYRIMLPTII